MIKIEKDLKITEIRDFSKYYKKEKETKETRKVILACEDEDGILKIDVTGFLEDHPFKRLDRITDVNEEATVKLTLFPGKQKKLDAFTTEEVET